jgi:hypothetical protein
MSVIKMHTLARIPADYDREAALAEKRFHALSWVAQHKPTAPAYHDGVTLDAATAKARAEANELELVAEQARKWS